MASDANTTSLDDRVSFDTAAKEATDTPKKEVTDAPKEETPKSDLPEAQADGTVPVEPESGLREPEFDVDVKLVDLQADPNNPLYSVKSFDDLKLPQDILKGIYSMNFRRPSKIQERALPLLLRDPPTNLVGQSQSGTGKTAAFTLNILHRINVADPSPQALVLAPSRELARQIEGVIKAMGGFIEGLKIATAIPDPSKRGQKTEGQVVVGTPGTVMDQIRRRQLDATKMKILVLDEADNMLDQQGMGDQCKRVKNLLPKAIQVVLFSATFPPDVLHYAHIFAPNSNTLTLKQEELNVAGIKQFYFDCNGDEDKYRILLKFYGLMTIASSIIFVKRRDTAAEIQRRMEADGHQVAQLSGALEGPERDVIIDKFRSGAAKVLITTNVLARGIDVQSVTMVINYDIPELQGGKPDPETYLHRIGRTGRFGRVGVAISFVHDRKSWQQLQDIQRHFKTDITTLPTDDWDTVEETVKKVIKSNRAGKTTKEMMEA